MPRTIAELAKDFNIEGIAYSSMLFIYGGTLVTSQIEDGINQVDLQETILPFWLGQYPVTQELWKWVVGGENPAHFRGKHRPVENVNYYRIVQEFLPALNEKIKRPDGQFRLPSEAEWIWAAFAKTSEDVYSGAAQPEAVAWYIEDSHMETKPVGLIKCE